MEIRQLKKKLNICTLDFNHNLHRVYYPSSKPQTQIPASQVAHTLDWGRRNATAPYDLKWKNFVGNLQLSTLP